jgi:hypothetical protein
MFIKFLGWLLIFLMMAIAVPLPWGWIVCGLMLFTLPQAIR